MDTNYRKIYERHYGPIPKDSDGRAYEIHHVDGDHSNNKIENLKLVTIQEHYDIHYSQKDWGACLLISRAMSLSPEEKSELAKLENKKRIAEGRHHFVGLKNPVHSKIKNGDHIFLGPALNKKMLEEGKHSSQNLESLQKNKRSHLKRVTDGKNHLVGGWMQKELVAQGKHHLQRRPDGTSFSSDKVKDGSHNFLGSSTQLDRLRNGTHPSQTKMSCLQCKEIFSLNTFSRHNKKCVNKK